METTLVWKYGTRILYGNHVVWIYDSEYGCYDVFVWILVVPFLKV